MKRLTYLLILAALPAYAQINLGGLFGGGSTSPYTAKANWSCQQQDYPAIKQIRNSGEVQLKFKDENGELKIEFKPNIFKVQPVSLEFVTSLINKPANVIVDYTECLARFKEAAQQAINKIRNEQCANNNQESICTRNPDDLLTGLDRQIQEQKYFEGNADRVTIPRIMPGSNSGVTTAVAAAELQKFCANEAADNLILFSAEGLRQMELEASKLTSPVGALCLNRLKEQLTQYQESMKSQVCSVSDKLCSTITKAVDLTLPKISTYAKTKEDNIEKSDKMWRTSLYLPTAEEEAAASVEIKRLIEAQPFQCYALNGINAANKHFNINRLPNAFSENIEALSKVADINCMKQLIQNYALGMNNMPEYREDFKKYCEENKTPLCTESVARQNQALENLRKLFFAGYGELGQRYLSECEDCLDDPAQDIKDLLQKVQDSRKALTCIDLKAGEAKVVSGADGSPSGISGNYTLRKRADGGHDVLVSMQVNSNGEYGVSSDEMFNRVQACMKDVTPFFKGPAGQQLNLSILSVAETNQLPANQRPPVRNISIQSPGGRSNSGSYEADIDCPTITHEVLHLLGLCDEYNGTGDGYTCRAAPKIASVMANQNTAFANAVDQTFTCKCEAGSTCRRVMTGSDEQFKKFYMMPSVYSATDYQFRNDACKTKYLPTINWNAATMQATAVIEKEQSANHIVIQTQGLGDNWPKIERSEVSCRCSEGDDECLSRLNTFKESVAAIPNSVTPYCPSGSGWSPPVYGAKLDANTPFEYTGDAVRFVRKAQWPSLLHPNHYERIVGGACDQKAKKYNECAVWAYRSKDNTNNCAGKPEYCSDDSEFLGVTQQ